MPRENKKTLRSVWSRRLVRPLMYKLFTRGVLALAVIKLWQHFQPGVSGSDLCVLVGLVFALGSFVAYLRFDGARIPQLRLPRMKRKTPGWAGGDIADHISDDLILFDDLDSDEQALCVFWCDLILMPVFLAASLL